MKIRFCSYCGSEVSITIPAGDNRERHVCTDCDSVHYQNPKNVVGSLPEWGDRILLCKRAIEPRYGYWTLPAGFMENDETTQEAALRETWEEARARIELIELQSLMNLPHVNQLYLIYRARLLDTDFYAGEESLEVRLFREEEIPWDELAFATIYHTLKFYFEDRRRGQFSLHAGDVVPGEQQYNEFFLQRRPDQNREDEAG